MKQRDEVGGRFERRAGPGAPRDPAALFTENLPLIARAARHAARRGFLGADEIEDFVSEVYVKILDQDYAVLRAFEGKSSLSTYLTSVIMRAFSDFQIRRWGRWRPSALAKHLGPLAEELERLVQHDDRTLEEACAILETSGHQVDRKEAESLLVRLPVRFRRRLVDADHLAELPAVSGDPEAGLRAEEHLETARRAEKHLAEALARLSPEDRLLVKLAFSVSLTVSAIARTLKQNQRRLFRRLESCKKVLRAHLERCGLDASSVRVILGDPAVRMDLPELRTEGVETSPAGPSHSSEVDPVGADPA
ncbi:MAG TPA: sigma-70 family RNA polymerase sigma factor [Candidatus Polarisedimenticolia bacterium]|nr:sigma-70 family RNA polymerase sigma factor [Candidatus Polarisedimenticolia bacterium]